jgi:hypothetical protein
MSEWWTYRPSDFLLFAPRTYYRLIEIYNQELWPAQIAALAVILIVTTMAWRASPGAGRVVAIALAIAWALSGWRFHWHHYATINWAAPWFAVGFALQALLLMWAAMSDRLAYAIGTGARRTVGGALVALAVVVQPTTALALGRPSTQIEVAGLFPDPTAIATVGLLVAAHRAHWSLYPLPLAWCVISALTLRTMAAPDAILPAVAAAVAVLALVASRRTVLPRVR